MQNFDTYWVVGLLDDEWDGFVWRYENDPDRDQCLIAWPIGYWGIIT